MMEIDFALRSTSMKWQWFVRAARLEWVFGMKGTLRPHRLVSETQPAELTQSANFAKTA